MRNTVQHRFLPSVGTDRPEQTVNNVHPDHMLQTVASDQGLDCLVPIMLLVLITVNHYNDSICFQRRSH